jgi:hypothetical protein
VLAKSHRDLALAESSSQRAVELLEKESTETVLDGVNARSFQGVVLLLASWDTLGWVYFTEGKTDLAAEYVEGSWKNGGHAEVGLHLGEIVERQGDKARAMQIYETALSEPKTNVATSVTNELRMHQEALQKQGISGRHVHGDGMGGVLQEQRTFRIPRPSGAKGSAVLLVQVSAAKTEHVEMISGDDAMHGLVAAVAGMNLGLGVPKSSHALLLRSGVLFCSTEPTCEFVLTPPETANVK